MGSNRHPWLRSYPMTGRRLLVAISLALAAMCTALVATAGSADLAAHLVIRWTARTSFVLFALAYAARPAVQLWPSAATKRLLAERRWLGLGFAVSHAFHLAGIIALAAPDPAGFIRAQDPSIAIAVVMFGLLFAMAFTSPARWKRLHATGTHLAWVVFVTSYAGAIGRSPLFALPVAISLAIAAMRCAAWLRSRRRVALRVAGVV